MPYLCFTKAEQSYVPAGLSSIRRGRGHIYKFQYLRRLDGRERARLFLPWIKFLAVMWNWGGKKEPTGLHQDPDLELFHTKAFISLRKGHIWLVSTPQPTYRCDTIIMRHVEISLQNIIKKMFQFTVNALPWLLCLLSWSLQQSPMHWHMTEWVWPYQELPAMCKRQDTTTYYDGEGRFRSWQTDILIKLCSSWRKPPNANCSKKDSTGVGPLLVHMLMWCNLLRTSHKHNLVTSRLTIVRSSPVATARNMFFISQVSVT